ncbi:hypothetical protein NLY44_16995 [Mesorhizobium sp. C089B]|uniref:hypothetical protein n=1 Tax=Mesorhizobium sp. C089B TaxID=2956823 RepID=UPI002577E8FC|nr:hypothetical protein [Mesorhizobium sp. C089B]WJI48405.1 hypothetical protein NLY44_16995 [Mesorhizobium sp. C089B]
MENYIPPKVLHKLAGKVLNADCYADIVALPELKPFGGDKIALAHSVVEELGAEGLLGHLDLKMRLDQLGAAIANWNGA